MNITAIRHPHVTLAKMWHAERVGLPGMELALDRVQAGVAQISRILYAAEAHGWTIEYRVFRYMAGTHGMRRAYFLTRPGEELALHLDYYSGGSIAVVRGHIATGPVTTQDIYRDTWIREREVIEWLSVPARADYPDTEWVLVVGPGYTERRHYETACNYAEYRVAPGVYPVQITDAHGRGVAPGARGYWAVAIAPSVKFHDYYVSQLGSASSLDESWEESPATTHMRIYAFQLETSGRRSLPEDITGRAFYIRRADLPAELATAG